MRYNFTITRKKKDVSVDVNSEFWELTFFCVGSVNEHNHIGDRVGSCLVVEQEKRMLSVSAREIEICAFTVMLKNIHNNFLKNCNNRVVLTKRI